MRIEFRWTTENGDYENALKKLDELVEAVHKQTGIPLQKKFSRNTCYLFFPPVESLNEKLQGSTMDCAVFVNIAWIDSKLCEHGIRPVVLIDGSSILEYAANRESWAHHFEQEIREAIQMLDATKKWIKHQDFAAITRILKMALP